jgi:hypothetical protein
MLHVFSINRVKLVACTPTTTDIKGQREYLIWDTLRRHKKKYSLKFKDNPDNKNQRDVIVPFGRCLICLHLFPSFLRLSALVRVGDLSSDMGVQSWLRQRWTTSTSIGTSTRLGVPAIGGWGRSQE